MNCFVIGEITFLVGEGNFYCFLLLTWWS